MGTESILPFVIVPVVLAVAVVIWYLVWQAGPKRREALRQAAESLGLDFTPEAAEVLGREFTRLRLFKLGHGHKATNLLRGRVEHEELLVFDYRYTTGGGKNQNTRRQTVAVLALGPRAALPEFELRPENIFHRIGAALGYQDIDFPDHPDFSKRYLVRGQDEAAVRRLFDGTVIEAVENLRDICIEGNGAWLVIYRAGRRVDPTRLAGFLEEARSLRAVFARRTELRHA